MILTKPKFKKKHNFKMYSLVNSAFNRTYNPSGKQNALSDIKRLLTSRDTAAQNKACGYLLDVITRYNNNSDEGSRMVEYLLDNDITVFLCEATSNLDFTLFRCVLSCLRLLWRQRRFFAEEHAAHSMTAVLRALAHYAGSGSRTPIESCLHFLCDLLNGISIHKTTPPLSQQSAYSTIQLLACLDGLSQYVSTNPNSVLSSALVLEALISYQPDNLTINLSTANAVLKVLKKWFELVMAALNHSMLMGDNCSGMFFVVICQLGMDILRLIKLMLHDQKVDFVHTILTDDQEASALRQCAVEMGKCVSNVLIEVVVFTKEHQTQLSSQEYSVFLKFLLNYFYSNTNDESLPDFCDMLFSKGYLTMLPQVQVSRNDVSVRKVSTLVLGEMLKVLAEKYLNIDAKQATDRTCSKDIHMGLVELQYGIEKPQSIGTQLQKRQPYSLLIYIYFYCQSSENPEEATAPLLPYLVEYILTLPKNCSPPPYIIKALWLVFAMSAISNGFLETLAERVYLEKATDRLISLLQPEPSVYYTHNPAILLWVFTPHRIHDYLRLQVLSQWLKLEECLPTELTSQPKVWEQLIIILIQCKDNNTLENCMEALRNCIKDGDETAREGFAALIWSMLPNILSKALIDSERQIDTNICHFLEITTTLIPLEVDSTIYLKAAVLVTLIFSKNTHERGIEESRYHFEYVCLKLGFYFLSLASDQNDNRVLMTYMNRPGFLPSVLTAADSTDERVACVALQLLSYIIHSFANNAYQPRSVHQIQTHTIIRSLHRDTTSERGASLIQLVYMVMSSSVHSPLALAYDQTCLMKEDLVTKTLPVVAHYNALRALMFRIQMMLCSKESVSQSAAGWKTLTSIFKHALFAKNDKKLIATLTSQPWTHSLIQFQVTQQMTQEFLEFLKVWLPLLKLTITMEQEKNKIKLSKYSLVIKTMVLLKKNLVVEDESKELNERNLVIVREILDGAGIRFRKD